MTTIHVTTHSRLAPEIHELAMCQRQLERDEPAHRIAHKRGAIHPQLAPKRKHVIGELTNRVLRNGAIAITDEQTASRTRGSEHARANTEARRTRRQRRPGGGIREPRSQSFGSGSSVKRSRTRHRLVGSRGARRPVGRLLLSTPAQATPAARSRASARGGRSRAAADARRPARSPLARHVADR